MKKLTDKQKADNAIKWINGLKSTRHLQGSGALGNSKQGFCCLGYACHKLKIPFIYDEAFSTELVNIIGLNDEYGTISNGCNINGLEFNTLAEINDDTSLSFRRISTLIKKRAEDIFELPVAKIIIQNYKK